MSNLAFYATPIDFNKNEQIEQKIKDAKKTKLSLDALKRLAQPKEEDIRNIHEQGGDTLKEDNKSILDNFYKDEMEKDIKNKVDNQTHKQALYRNENVQTDYLITNNLDANKINHTPMNIQSSNQDLLTKLNYIIDMFEEQKDIRTNQKNEEVVLYCFLGIFVIYVLDSFVYIGKYKR